MPNFSLSHVAELKLSPDVAAKRLQAARAAGEFPALLAAVADGRLNVSAVVLLAPHLTSENAAELVEATARLAQKDIKAFLAWRFPRAGGPASLPSLGGPGQLEGSTTAVNVREHAAQQDLNPAAPSDPAETREAMVPLSSPVNAAPLRFPLHASITQETRQKLAYARAALRSLAPPGVRRVAPAALPRPGEIPAAQPACEAGSR